MHKAASLIEDARRSPSPLSENEKAEDHPPVDEPSIVPQSAGFASRRAGCSSPCLRSSRGQRGPRVAFVKVDLAVGMGSMVARKQGVAATPTFGFFLDGKKVRVWLAWFSPFC